MREEMEKELDSLYPRLRIGQKCPCGKPAEHVHHLIGRNNQILRWDVKNLLPLCAECHAAIHDKGMWNHGLDLVDAETRAYLEARKNVLLKDYLREKGQSFEDFAAEKRKDILENVGRMRNIVQNSDEWLSEKQGTIGGSEIAAVIKSFVPKERLMEIMGERAATSFLNEPLYTTGYLVFHKIKNGYRQPPIPDELNVYGHAAESYVEWALRDNADFEVRRCQDFIKRPDISPFASCSPDGYCVAKKEQYNDVNGRPITERNPVWECKTIQHFKAIKEDALKRGLQWQYLFQIQYNAMICGRDCALISSMLLPLEQDTTFNRGVIASLIEQKRFEEVQERFSPEVFTSVYGLIPEMQAAIKEALRNFEQAIAENNPPEINKDTLSLMKKDFACYQEVERYNASGAVMLSSQDQIDGQDAHDWFNDALFFAESIRLDDDRNEKNKLLIKKFMMDNNASEIYTLDGGKAKLSANGRLSLQPLKNEG